MVITHSNGHFWAWVVCGVQISKSEWPAQAYRAKAQHGHEECHPLAAGMGFLCPPVTTIFTGSAVAKCPTSRGKSGRTLYCLVHGSEKTVKQAVWLAEEGHVCCYKYIAMKMAKKSSQFSQTHHSSEAIEATVFLQFSNIFPPVFPGFSTVPHRINWAILQHLRQHNAPAAK